MLTPPRVLGDSSRHRHRRGKSSPRVAIPRDASTSSSRLSSSSSSSSSSSYDVIVIGGGHAGSEAACASARAGARTLLITQDKSTLGELSCNPSIGGIGKGHLVREIDALDGIMGEVADRSGIHFRMLNRRKGPAVRGPRAQMDRDVYKSNMRRLLLGNDDVDHRDDDDDDNRALRGMMNLDIMEASADDLLLDEGVGIETLAPLADPSEDSSRRDGGGGEGNRGEVARLERSKSLSSASANASNRRARIRGVVAIDSNTKERIEIESSTVVLTTGTFLRGVLMIGRERYSGGRHLRDSESVEPPSVGLALTLERFGFPLGRLKTGTPARLDGRTIDWSACLVQPSEKPAMPFSHVRQSRGEEPPLACAGRLIDCYQTATNEETHRMVMEYSHLLPEYDGMDGKGNGPRYCPSIYKKVERFAERKSHNSFLEPEGLNTHIVYPNGMSGPYPEEIQQKIFRSMKGLEKVEIVRPGYDVEYDFVNPQVLTHTLETKSIAGLYLAGQICGTTGYEEAAAQGIIAGANAGRAAGAAHRGEKAPVPFVLGRDEAYIGVLIDDLVTRGTFELYRMFTSQAEYRISLRADNTDLRLTRKGAEHGLVTDLERLTALDMRRTLIEDNVERLRNFKLFVTDWGSRGGNNLMGGIAAHRPGRESHKKCAEEVLGMPNVSLKMVEDIMADVLNESPGKSNDLSSMMIPTPSSVYDTVKASMKYKSYVVRQEKDIESWRKAQGARIPPNIIYDHARMPTFSKEEIKKLDRFRPTMFVETSQISGLTPQSLVYLYHHVMKLNKETRREKREENAPV
ncbi:hypothetical protein ACHAXA_007769 [Cyclostephanos tholiformis]|uniref:tRNA uridine 5-carboxymethylaminomethyl modification enzyme C-terminal subdomain domain-containing protein n=1 Tax=Cyclostephanos tholiformis TaxID=382380 RepID=A0ABD3R8X2_9STRA